MGDKQTIEETENEIVEEFALFDSWDDKYEYIIDLGKRSCWKSCPCSRVVEK